MQTPHFIVIKASAGAGKTFELTRRLAQFLVTPEVKNNKLRNIIAITFSNAATNEMKKRTLKWLKGLALEDEKTTKDFLQILNPTNGNIVEEVLSTRKDELVSRAERILSEILTHYNDLQIRTIDSFMTSVFSATAIDFGYLGEFDILMDNRRFIDHALDIFLNENIVDGKVNNDVFMSIEKIILDLRSNSSFKWDITKNINEFFIEIYEKSSSMDTDLSDDIYDRDIIIKRIKDKYEEINNIIDYFDLDRKKRGGFFKLKDIIENKTWDDLIKLSIKEGPVNKPKDDSEIYEEIQIRWNALVEDIKEYALCYSKNYYSKVVSFFNEFKAFLDEYKKKESVIFINDINKTLVRHINIENPPEIYFLLGEIIYHYFIDEFQDTSPIQWKCMFPLLENSLSNGGTLFIVGDTKQAIYGFRNTDWRIMKRLSDKEERFLSTDTSIKELTKNYRNRPFILEFNKRVFKEILSKDLDLGFVGDMSGLTTFEQECNAEGSKGFVRCILLERENLDSEEIDLDEKIRNTLKGLIEDIRGRGYRLKDIAILTQKNEYVVKITNFLLSEDIPALSLSSLDVRKRHIIIDIVSLLDFLNSPLNDLAFSTFLQSDTFLKCSKLKVKDIRNFIFEREEGIPLYLFFRERFGDIWELLFERLYTKVGYLPLYDLICEIYNTFDLFNNFREEEGSLLKFLEVVKDFEGFQFNNLSAFLKEIKEDEDDKRWNINLPEGIDAVNIMTIHKSKGLEFPVVIALLYEKSDRNTNSWIIKEEDGKGRLVRVTKMLSEKGDLLEKWYEEKNIFETSNDLNSLYVCLTRAERELYVIGVKKNKERKFPLNLIPFEDYSKHQSEERYLFKEEQQVEVQPLYIKPQKEPFYLDFKAGLTDKEVIRGDLIHSLLKKIIFVEEGIEDIIDKEIKRLNALYNFDCDIKTSDILSFLYRDDVRPFFEKKDKRLVFTEKEVVDSSGRLLRIDRLVIDPSELAVIDFKTGVEFSEEYNYQVKGYLNVIKDIWKESKVKGYIIYFDKVYLWEITI